MSTRVAEPPSSASTRSSFSKPLGPLAAHTIPIGESLSNRFVPGTVPTRQFRLEEQSDTAIPVSEHDRLPWNRWLKELRAELGRAQGKKKITQNDLATLLGLDLSAIGRLEMKKKSEHARKQPERDTYLKLMEHASPGLRARAPQVPPAGGPGNEPSGPENGLLDGSPARTYPTAGGQQEMTAEIDEVVRLMKTWPKAAQAALRDEAYKRNGDLLANPIEADRASK